MAYFHNQVVNFHLRFQDFLNGTRSQEHYENFFHYWNQLQTIYSAILHDVPSLCLIAMPYVEGKISRFEDESDADILEHPYQIPPNDWNFITDLLEQGDAVKLIEKNLQGKIKYANQVSRVFTILFGTIYAINRIVILVLAFATLRQQDERVYVETWTKNLPNIG